MLVPSSTLKVATCGAPAATSATGLRRPFAGSASCQPVGSVGAVLFLSRSVTAAVHPTGSGNQST